MKRGAFAAVVTVLFAAAAAVGVFLFMDNVRSDAAKPAETVQVLVSSRDIPAGQAFDPLIADGVFSTKAVAVDDVVQGALTDEYQLQGQRSAYPILAGEQISASRIAGPLQASGGVLGIPDGYQAAALTLEPQRIVAGALGQGDHVEVFGTFAVANGRTQTTRVVIADAQVLRVANPGDTTGTAPGTTVTLAVTPAEASILIYSQEQGHVWLTLLPPNEKGVQVPAVTSKGLR
jgi:pilus assembly protein CpaB